jgi:DNA gyrase/topoisomerase IV subunit B
MADENTSGTTEEQEPVLRIEPVGRETEKQPSYLDDAAQADDLFSVLMGEDVEARRQFIQRNAKDVRFLDI